MKRRSILLQLISHQKAEKVSILFCFLFIIISRKLHLGTNLVPILFE